MNEYNQAKVRIKQACKVIKRILNRLFLKKILRFEITLQIIKTT
jgi:hypothetical protein